MKKKYLSSILILVFILLLAQSSVLAQNNILDQEAGKYKVGFMASFPSYGLSGIMEINDKVSVQGILAPMGDLSNYSVRGLYKIEERESWHTYGYGSIGLWTHKYTDYSNNPYGETETESAIGIGAGVGIEYDWSIWYGEDTPPISSSLEIGFGSVGLDNYNYSAISIGAATHYKF